MRNHRRKCGSLTKLIESKTENENSDHEETIAPTSVTNTIVWNPENFEGIVDEPVNQSIEKVNQTTYEIIQSDIQRHSDIQRSHKKSSSSKRRRSSIDSSSIDVSLSRFLIGCNLPFDTVDSHHFKQFINKINKDYLVPTSSDLTRIVLSQLEKSTSPKSSKKRKNYQTTESESEDD